MSERERFRAGGETEGPAHHSAKLGRGDSEENGGGRSEKVGGSDNVREIRQIWRVRL